MTPYPWTMDDVLSATGGELVSGSADASFTGIGIDSRTILPAQLFVAIAGEVHDGHRFIPDVIDEGVTGVMVAEPKLAGLPMDRVRSQGIVCVSVPDTTVALGDMARFNRNRRALKVVAITGSNGKTSTRNFTEKVMATHFSVLGTRGNLNNHIGLPLTLFGLSLDHQVAVLELGMNHPKEIDYLGHICQPDLGVITNVGPAHLEGLGTMENIARAKGELLSTIRSDGTAILNGDDARVAGLADTVDRRVIFFGTDPAAQIRAIDIRSSQSETAFTLVTPSGETPITLSTPARVMVTNALAAAAAGEAMGVPLEKIKEGLEAFSPGAGRMGIDRPGKEICLVDDSYNANPGSMAAAIETLSIIGENRRTIAVLGDMLELGDQSAFLHEEIGRKVGAFQIDRLFASGRFADFVAKGAMDEKMAQHHIVTGDKQQVVSHLIPQIRPGDCILVKGSRGMAMETVVQEIVRWAKNGETEV